MEPKDMTRELSKQSDLSLMMRIRDLDIPRGTYWGNPIITELLRRLNEADVLRKENEELKEKVYFFARTFRYYAGEAFRFYEKHPLARETDETRAANTTKESEASHDRSGEATND